MDTYWDSLAIVLRECRDVLEQVDPASVEEFVKLVLASERVFFVGTGRVSLSLRSVATRFRHIGIEAYCVGQTGEPPIGVRDLLVVGSGTGESIFPVAIARRAKEFGVRIVHIGSNPNSSLRAMTDHFVRIPAATKHQLPGEVPSAQAMTSLFEQCLLLFGDVVADMIIGRKGLEAATLWQRHTNLE